IEKTLSPQGLGLAFSADGRVATSAGQYAAGPQVRGAAGIKVWNALRDEPSRQLPGHPGGVICADFSPDGRRLVTGGQDKTVRLWDLTTGRELAKWQGEKDEVCSVAYSPDGKQIAYKTPTGWLGLLDAETRGRLFR